MPEWDRLSDMAVEDLRANSTAYDVATAAPSDDVLRLQFTLLATVNAVVATSCLFLLASMLRSPKVREQSFNLYLVAITFPDFVMSFACLFTCAMSAASAAYFSESMCGFQSWFLVWAIASNCWVNAVISHQVHKMLKVSHGRGRYNPPTRVYVVKQVGCVYVYAAFLASVSAWNIPGVPLESGSYRGFVCFPKTYDTASTIFFWLVFCPLYLFIPAFYVLWCAADIWRRKMIPPAGRRRALAIYFLRIVFVFIVMWIPYFLLAFIIGPSLPSLEAAWVIWAACVVAHLQGLVNVILCSGKQDIRKCVFDTLSLLTFGYCDSQNRNRKQSKNRSTQGTEGLSSVGQGTGTSASHGISEREPSRAEADEGLESSLARAAANEEPSPENYGSDEGDVDRTIHDRISRDREARPTSGAQDCMPAVREGTEGDPELNPDAMTEEQAMDIWLRSNSEVEAERLRESQRWRDEDAAIRLRELQRWRDEEAAIRLRELQQRRDMEPIGIGVAGGHWERLEAGQEGIGEGEGYRPESGEGLYPDTVYIDRPQRSDERGLRPPDSGAGYLYNPLDAVAHAFLARDLSEGENSADTTNSPLTSIPSDDSALRVETLDLQRAVVESQAAHIAHTRQQVEQDIRFRQEMEMTAAASAGDVARRRSSGTGSDEARLVSKAVQESLLLDEQDQQEAARKYHRDLERALAVSRDETKVSEDDLVEDAVRQNLDEGAAKGEEERSHGGSSDEEMLRRVMMQSLDEERQWR